MPLIIALLLLCLVFGFWNVFAFIVTFIGWLIMLPFALLVGVFGAALAVIVGIILMLLCGLGLVAVMLSLFGGDRRPVVEARFWYTCR